MKQFTSDKKKFYQFESFSRHFVFHFSTTKVGWNGNGKSRFTGDSETEYREYRKELATGLALQEEQLIFPRQTHSDHVAVISKLPDKKEIANTDALITSVSGLCICVQTADCVPILLYEPKKKVAAAVHAGWRGTISQITAKTIQTMIDEFQCKPEDIIAGIGPSISGPNYEVGIEVINAVEASFKKHQDLLSPNGNAGKACLDLWKANEILLKNMGIPSGNIEVMGLCSFAGKDEFYSARRDGAQTGRMATGIMIL